MWLKIFMAKNTKWVHYSTQIVNSLDQLIQGLTWAEKGVLSPVLVPTANLVNMMEYVHSHLAVMPGNRLKAIPTSVADLHRMMTFYMSRARGQLIIHIDIPLTTYELSFKVYEVHAHAIKIPNSELDSLLEVEHRYVAIHRYSGAHIVLTSDEAKEVSLTKYHLIHTPIIRLDQDQSCIMAIYSNRVKLATELCKYIVKPAATLPSVVQLDEYLFFIRNIANYSIECVSMVHENRIRIREKVIQYTCIGECSVNV